MEKVVLPILLMIFFVACSGQNSSSSQETDVNVLEPMKYDDEFVQYFVKGESGRIYITLGNNLRQLYENKYKKTYCCYKDFIDAITDNLFKPSFDSSEKNICYFDYSFKIDSKVIQLYKKYGLGYILSKYCIKEKEKIHFKTKYEQDFKYTIAYCFWINGYVFITDCYKGTQYIVLSQEGNHKIIR